jgi:putative membrane protein
MALGMDGQHSAIGDDLGLGIQVPGPGRTDKHGHTRVHPVTPLIHAVSAIPVIVIILIGLSGPLASEFGGWPLLGTIAATLVGCAGVAAVATLAWRNRSYWFDEDGDFRMDSGILRRQQRRLQLSRLQSVDVVQPLAARLFSMAAVTLEAAGGSDSRIQLRYLPLAEARELRSAVLARAGGLDHAAGEAPEQVIAFVPPGQLALSLLLRTSTAGLVLLTALILFGTVATEGWGGIPLAIVTGGVPAFIIATEFMKYFNFTVAESPDGLRLRFGLVQTQTRTVPAGRVQAVGLVEPLLWRRQGWVRVQLNVAGVDTGDDKREETILTPVSDRATAARIIERVLPGVDLDDLVWCMAPPRARWRSPVQWGQLAVAWTDAVFAARAGRITRHRAYILHARTQSVRLTDGPWERALGLASVHVDSTKGPVRISGLHLDAGFAAQVAQEQAGRARTARAKDTGVRPAGPRVPDSPHGNDRFTLDQP